MIEKKYILKCGNVTISSIDNFGILTFGEKPVEFNTYEDARMYLKESMFLALASNRTDFTDWKRIKIVQITIKETGSTSVINTAFCDNFERITKFWRPEYHNILSPMLVAACMNGFTLLGFTNVKDVQKFLTDPKYIDIVRNTVPIHIQSNPSLYMYSGISTCTNEEKGAIMITSPEEILSLYNL